MPRLGGTYLKKWHLSVINNASVFMLKANSVRNLYLYVRLDRKSMKFFQCNLRIPRLKGHVPNFMYI